MTKLKWLDRITKVKPNYHELYTNAFNNKLEKVAEGWINLKALDLDTRKNLIYFGVKMINSGNYKNMNYQSLVNTFKLISTLEEAMGTLSPKEFQTLFPIAKEYDGEKLGIKDYFYTRRFIERFGNEKVIGEQITDFLWNYNNWEIVKFVVKSITVEGDCRKREKSSERIS